MRRRFAHLAIGVVVAVGLVTGALFVPTPARAQTINYGTAVVNTSFLNVRSGPGSQYLVIGVVVGGQELPVTGVTKNRDWWGVQTAYGDGFVFAEFVLYRGDPSVVPIVGSPGNAAPEAPTAIVLAQSLNVRAGPTVNAASLGVVPQKFVLSVTGQHVESGWYQVVSPFGVGWVANDEVTLAGDTSLIPRVDSSGGGGAIATLATTSPSAFTTSTGVGAGSLTTLTSAAATSTLVESNASLTGVTTVAEEQLSFVPTGFAITGTAAFDALFIRSRPWSGSAIVGAFEQGDAVTVMGRNEDANFFLVESPNGPGWVRENGLRLVGIDSFQLPIVDINPQLKLAGLPAVPNGGDISVGGFTGFTSHADVIVHIRPQLEAPAIGSLGAGVHATAIGRDFDLMFLQIETPFGVGWVRNEQDFKLESGLDAFKLPINAVNGIPVGGQTTSVASTGVGSIPGIAATSTTGGSGGGTLVGPVVVVNTSNLNLRSGAGPQYSVLSVVTGGTQYTVTGMLSDRSWYRVNTPFGEGWLYGEFVVFRGDPSGVPVVRP